MTRRFTHALEITIGERAILEFEFEFTVSPYVPEQGPSYASGGQPAEGGEVEVLSAVLTIETNWMGLEAITKTPAPDWLFQILSSDEDIIDKLRLYAAEQDDGPDPDEAYERMRDER